MIHIEVDTQAEIEKIAKRLEWQAIKAPDVLRLSINAAARKVRKQIPDNVEDAYTIDPSVLKDRKRGAPTVQTAKPGNIMAVIRSKGPVNELSDFLAEEGSRGVKTKVRKDGGKKLLERAGATAFKVTFRSTHMAIAQRRIGETYTTSGAADRVEKYGMPRRGQWPDMTRIKVLTGPSVPSMMGNEEVQERTRTILYDVLDREIEKRIEKTIQGK